MLPLQLLEELAKPVAYGLLDDLVEQGFQLPADMLVHGHGVGLLSSPRAAASSSADGGFGGCRAPCLLIRAFFKAC
jgi:hypothetical protein